MVINLLISQNLINAGKVPEKSINIINSPLTTSAALLVERCSKRHYFQY